MRRAGNTMEQLGPSPNEAAGPASGEAEARQAPSLPGPPSDEAAEQAFHELELTARLAELDRSIRALDRERERFFRLRYAVDLLEAELLYLRAERAEVRAQLRAWRAGARAGKLARRHALSRRDLASIGFAAFVLLGLIAMAFRSLGDVSSPPGPLPVVTENAEAGVPPTRAATRATTKPTATAAGPTATRPADVRYAVVAAEQLNVRLGPGLQYAIRRAVPAGAVLRLVRARNDDAGDVWWELEQGGWVHGGYIRFAATEDEARAYAERLP